MYKRRKTRLVVDSEFLDRLYVWLFLDNKSNTGVPDELEAGNELETISLRQT